MHKDDCIIVVKHKVQSENQSLKFMDILLDETLINDTVYVPLSCLQQVSTKNNRLPAKQNYEFLLRLALIYPVQLTSSIPALPDSYMVLNSEEDYPAANGLKTDCYIVSLYKKILLEKNVFDSAIQSILNCAEISGCYNIITDFLEDMLLERGLYQYFFQGSQPFLIYKGNNICYNILNVFAEQLGTALRHKGYLVEYFDLSKEPHTAASKYIGRSFQAVIGMQSYMFSARLTDNLFLHDKINGPKYNFVFDHINSFRQHIEHVPKNLTILTLDLNYAAFGRQYYSLNMRFLPPGGITKPFRGSKRIYDVVFIGSFFNNAEYISSQIKLMNRPMRFLVNRFWLYMRKYPHLPAEDILHLALTYYHKTLSDTEFKDLLHRFQHFTLYMAYRYRYKLIKTLIEHGIKVDVFGKSWKPSPLQNHPNFIWHAKNLSIDESLAVWQQSKIALNIMTWHKNAITERIINSMLQKSAVLTERNPYLEEEFRENENILFYDFAKLDELPGRIHSLLACPEQLAAIGERGYEKALCSHTWDCRAEELLTITQQDALLQKQLGE